MKPPNNLFSDPLTHPMKPGRLFPAFCLLGLLVFSNVFQNSFHLDDFHTILFNYHVHSLSEIPSYFYSGQSFSGTPNVSGYRPVTALVNALNYAVSGASPAGYHLVNLVLHLLCSFLVYRIASLLFKKASIGFLSGMLFLIHPANTEVVNYISSRSSSLSALFYLSSFLAFIHYRETAGSKWIVLSFAAFTLSLFCKEVAVTLPFILMAYDYFFPRSLPPSRKIGIYLVFLFLTILFLIARSHFMTLPGTGHTSGASIRIQGETARNIVLGGIYLATHYLFLHLFPYPLTIDHPFPKMEFSLFMGLSFIFWLLAAFLAVIYRQKRTGPFLAFWFLMNLLPVFILPGMTRLSIFQENRGYLSGAAVMMFLAWLFESLKNRVSEKSFYTGKMVSVLFALCLVLFSVESYLRNLDWKTETTLWSDAYQKNPDSFMVNFSLGYGYLEEQQFGEALAFFNRSLKLNPPKDYLYYIHNDLGTVYYRQGILETALQEYQTAEALSPHLPEAHINLGLIYLKKGAYRKAGEEMESEIDLNTAHLEQRIQAAFELEKKGENEAARRLLLKIARTLPDRSEFINIRKLVASRLNRISLFDRRGILTLPFRVKGTL